MLLEGSCQCGKVRFTVESTTPYPYQICFCSICRKCTGGAFGCNIMGRHDTLVVHGKRSLKRYHARVHARGKTTLAEGWRAFCGACGTHLWLEDKRWPDGIWPNAGAIDTKLPVPPVVHVHHDALQAGVGAMAEGARAEVPRVSQRVDRHVARPARPDAPVSSPRAALHERRQRRESPAVVRRLRVGVEQRLLQRRLDLGVGLVELVARRRGRRRTRTSARRRRRASRTPAAPGSAATSATSP